MVAADVYRVNVSFYRVNTLHFTLYVFTLHTLRVYEPWEMSIQAVGNLL